MSTLRKHREQNRAEQPTIQDRLKRHGITFERIGANILIINGHVDDEAMLCATLKCSRDELQTHLRNHR